MNVFCLEILRALFSTQTYFSNEILVFIREMNRHHLQKCWSCMIIELFLLQMSGIVMLSITDTILREMRKTV